MFLLRWCKWPFVWMEAISQRNGFMGQLVLEELPEGNASAVQPWWLSQCCSQPHWTKAPWGCALCRKLSLQHVCRKHNGRIPHTWQFASPRSSLSWKVPGKTSGVQTEALSVRKLTGVHSDNFPCQFKEFPMLSLFFSVKSWVSATVWKQINDLYGEEDWANAQFESWQTVHIVWTGSVLNQL